MAMAMAMMAVNIEDDLSADAVSYCAVILTSNMLTQQYFVVAVNENASMDT